MAGHTNLALPNVTDPPNVTEPPSANGNTPNNVPETPNENLRSEKYEGSPDICKAPSQNDQNATEQAPTPPHQRKTRKDPLEGLPQYDEAAYGCGRRREVAGANAATAVVPDHTAPASDGVAALDVAEIQDPGGEDVIEFVLASVGNEPSLQDALNGHEACD